MKKYFNWTVSITLLLIMASAVTYIIHFLIFRDSHHIFIYMIGDVGFLFLDVLLVILFIERLLNRREKRIILKKLNMVIGTFFSEVGMELLNKFSEFVENPEQLEKEVLIQPTWGKKDFKRAADAAKNFSYKIRINKDGLVELRDFLLDKQSFLLRLLENPNLLEHEQFTDLLWAVFHLAEELSFRGDKIRDLPQSDYSHLAKDTLRAYSQITSIWIRYNDHLKESYPFLFSLTTRVNPLNPQASAIVV